MSDICYKPTVIEFFQESDKVLDVRSVSILPWSKIKVKSIDFPVNKPLGVAETTNLVWKMIRACVTDDGIGLAAAQIGVFKSLFVFSRTLPDLRIQFIPCFNPSFEAIQENGKEVGVEGCLSVPGRRINVNRWKTIKAKWYELDTDGNLSPREETMTGFEARVFQHERDHCFGISILDREYKPRT